MSSTFSSLSLSVCSFFDAYENTDDFTTSHRIIAMQCNASIRKVHIWHWNSDWRTIHNGQTDHALGFYFKRKIATKYFITRIKLRPIQFAIVRVVLYEMRIILMGTWINGLAILFYYWESHTKQRKMDKKQISADGIALAGNFRYVFSEIVPSLSVARSQNMLCH